MSDLRHTFVRRPLVEHGRWQCSGCRFVFRMAWQATCPCCGLLDFWSGSVDPMAPAWDGVERPHGRSRR